MAAGSGTFPAIGATWAGLVPQVTCGVMDAASSTTSLSKVAPSSVGRVRQYATAASQSSPCGAWSRSFR